MLVGSLSVYVSHITAAQRHEGHLKANVVYAKRKVK